MIDCRTFDNEQLYLDATINGRWGPPYFLLRSFDGRPRFSQRGVHELCIDRALQSSLRLKRWSRSQNCAIIWAILYFLTWEGETTKPRSVFKGGGGETRC